MLTLASIPAFAAKYEAESAARTDNATVVGTYVEMREGNLTFTVNASSAGMHELIVNYKQDNDTKKEQNLVVNGANVGILTFPRSATWTDLKSVVSLNTGSNTVAITKNWGWVDIDYIEINPYQATPFDLDKNLVNPNATNAAKEMFAFMQANFQKKVISGVMTGDVLSGNNAMTINSQTEVSHIRSKSGNKTPALVGFDFMHGTGKEYNDASGGWFLNYTNATISMAKELYQRGGIPAFCWHWRDPLKNTKGFYSPSSSGDVTDFNLTNACTNTSCTAWNTSSNEYKGIIEDIDKVADYLKELQTAGVPVLWRPVHEASGGWFWWGGKGAAAFKLLYNLLYDRLTTHHGLNNLIWVWNSEGADKDWYPGDNRVDIIGRDFYYNPQSTVNYASLIGEFEKLKNLFGTKKMLSLSENGSVPDPDNLVSDNAGWSYFMPWYGTFVTQSTSDAMWSKIMNHDYVITLEEMPGWTGETTPITAKPAHAASIDLKTLDFSKAKVYDIHGKRIFANNMTQLKSGVYIVKINGMSFKVPVR
ncbi:MAG: hypothetical protein FWC26_02345 [Fibromonadales bacterium]|nr:hypothetical protein [Fibromonadales bacterium]